MDLRQEISGRGKKPKSKPGLDEDDDELGPPPEALMVFPVETVALLISWPDAKTRNTNSSKRMTYRCDKNLSPQLWSTHSEQPIPKTKRSRISSAV